MDQWIGDKIIGTWKLVSWKYVDGDGHKQDFFGENPKGILMYDSYGYMNAQIMKKGRSKLASEGIYDGTVEERSDAFLSYFAYYGKYKEKKPGEVVHTVLGSLMPNWLKNKELRYAKVKGGRLVISTPPILNDGIETVHYIRWKRV